MNFNNDKTKVPSNHQQKTNKDKEKFSKKSSVPDKDADCDNKGRPNSPI